MYRPVLVTPPESTPVSLAEVKRHVRAQDFESDDPLLTALIAAAVSHLDGWTGVLGRCLCEQEWRQDFDRFSRCLRLPLSPVIEIGSVDYVDANDADQTVDDEDFSLLVDDLGPYVSVRSSYSYPTLSVHRPAVSVTYTAGYADDGSGEPIPAALKQAILLLVGYWYENRESVVIGQTVTAMPFAVDALIAPFRRVRF